MTQISTTPVARALGMIALAATAWGTGGVVATELFRSTGLGPFAVSFWRFAGGTVLLAAGHLISRARRQVPDPAARPLPSPTNRQTPRPTGQRTRGTRAWPRTLILGIGLAVYQTAYFLGCDLAGVAVATVVTLGAGPVLIAVGARILLVERLGRSGATTVLIAVVGLVALVGAGDGGRAPHRLAGIGWALLSAVGYALVTLLTRARAADAGTGSQPGTPMLWPLAVGTVMLLPFGLVDGLLPAGGQPVSSWAMLGYLAAVPTVLAYRLFFAALAHVRATTASVVALLEAVVAALLALWLLGERLSVQGWVGVLLLLGAVVTLSRTENAVRPA